MTTTSASGSNRSSAGRGKAKRPVVSENDGAASQPTVAHYCAEGDDSPECALSRFRFFIIDTGWKSTSAKVIRDNFAMIREHLEGDALYVLSREQSMSLVKRHPDMIGKDPIIMVHDLHAHKYHEETDDDDDVDYHGFRLNLGLITDGAGVLETLQRFLRFVSLHRRSYDIEQDIKDKLHRDGIRGSIEIIRSGSKDIMGG
jgi:hypothetical protein